MASNSSGALSPSKTYKLGDYTFRLVVTYLPDENITSVQCHASNGTSNKQTGKDYQGIVHIKSWSVVAEEKSASIYIDTDVDSVKLSVSSTYRVSPYITNNSIHMVTNCVNTYSEYASFKIEGADQVKFSCSGDALNALMYDNDPAVIASFDNSNTYHGNGLRIRTPGYYTISGSGFLTFSFGYVEDYVPHSFTIFDLEFYKNGKRVSTNSVSTRLIAKFEINVQDADGKKWDYPADTGEPSKTLHITVTGAQSGRHNDPLNDTTYHYTPSDREQADVYGSGGVGGNGGAGGAGASTVIIYTCGTDKAGYTEEIAIAKRHGYGSGAGKGGKGGDGCILVYY